MMTKRSPFNLGFFIFSTLLTAEIVSYIIVLNYGKGGNSI